MLGFFEWSGCLLGILGAVLVAVKSPHARWAWVLWLVSNASWTIYGLATANYALALQQGAFMITSTIGLWHWLLQPALVRAGAASEATEAVPAA
ncbi:MAG TPA: hypothetical protein PLE72_07550 [Azospira sp.]|nr:hypothetical protein [Azospira sp.]